MEENQFQSTPQEQNLFDNHYDLTQASSGKRLANYIIDLVIFYVIMFALSYVIVALNYDLAILIYGDGVGLEIVSRLISLLLYGMYMGLVEALFKGRSIGKLMTGTVAVNEDGSRVGGQTALLRGLSRAVPFNAFSALGSPCYPWHDRWTKTYVVEFKDLRQ
jgi:uncharacterized RDD family membrane protein YckC